MVGVIGIVWSPDGHGGLWTGVACVTYGINLQQIENYA